MRNGVLWVLRAGNSAPTPRGVDAFREDSEKRVPVLPSSAVSQAASFATSPLSCYAAPLVPASTNVAKR